MAEKIEEYQSLRAIKLEDGGGDECRIAYLRRIKAEIKNMLELTN